MSVIDQFGNVVDVWREMWNDFRENVDYTLEWQYRQAIEYLDNKYVQNSLNNQMLDFDPVMIDELTYQTVIAERFIAEIESHAIGTPCSIVYNECGDAVGGYNANGDYCSIGNLVL